MPKWPEHRIGEYLLEAVGSYKSLMLFDDSDDLGAEVINVLLRRAGYENNLNCLINKQFIPVAQRSDKIVVVYVHDHANMVCDVDAEALETYLRRRYSKINLRFLEELPTI